MKRNTPTHKGLLIRIRLFLALFVVALVVSGLTAVPIVWEVNILEKLFGEGTFMERWFPPMAHWISLVQKGVMDTERAYPFIFYGNDWLAFGHIVIAIALLGALRDPVKNIWVVEFAMIACILVIPVALVCGYFRSIPIFWRAIDCLFGVVGIIPLSIAHRYIRLLDLEQKNN